MIACWKCPMNKIDKCKEDSKYCKRYESKDSIMPNTIKEIEEIREAEILYWKLQEEKHE